MDLIRRHLRNFIDRTITVLCLTAILSSVLIVVNATGMPGQGDRNWSKKKKPSTAIVRQIRAAAGISEKSDSVIKELNTQVLAKRRQILMVEQFPGSGQCLAVHVIQDDSSQFRQVWMLDREPPGDGGICKFLGRSPQVRVGATGEILLQIPSMYIDMPKRIKEYAYAWNGHTYVLKHQRSVNE